MNWKKYKLKDLVINFSVRARDYGGSEGLEFLGVSNDDGIVKSKSAAEHKGEEYKIIEKGCFAYNPYRINIGSIAYHKEDIKGLISPAYVIFKTKPNSIKDELLFKFLKSAEGLRQIRFHGRGTVRQALRFEDLCKIEISIPSYEEQEVLISNIKNTETESNLISSELTHQLDLIKQLRQAFLREAMQGKLVTPVTGSAVEVPQTGKQLLEKIKAEKAQLIAKNLPAGKAGKLKKEKELPPITEDEIPFKIPEHWAWCRLGELAFDVSYGTSQKADDSSEIPVLRMGNITTDGKILYSNLKYVASNIKDLPKLYLKNGDLVFNRTNSYELVGKCGVFKNDKPYTLASYLIRVKLFENIHSDFISNYINSSFCRQTQIEPQIIQQNGQANFNGTKLSGIIVPLPPLHDQEQIVAKLEELMAFCDSLEQSIKESQGYNEKLLQQVLREALQPKVLSD